MLEIKNITKVYSSKKNTVCALDNVSINFGAKGLVVVLGKSGCGKSTLMNIIGGLDRETSGEVIINGKSTKTFSASQFDAYRNTYVGIVFQEFNLIDDISVFENIDMTLKIQEKNADVNTVDEALQMVGLANLGYRKPSELSGGQRQRVALARALLKKPEIILADEPTGSLDSVTSEDVFETLKRIAATKLVIVVTHDKELAATYGERIIILSDGKVVSDSMRCGQGNVDVKEVGDSVIEVAVGAKLKEDINQKLSSGQTTYIGVSHDKDRIALAYPDTVDSFYEERSKIKFEKTENIPTDNNEFKLKKGKLPITYAAKMAKSAIKRTKKRYRFLTFLTSITFTFICMSIIIGTISIGTLAANSTFEEGSANVISIGKTVKNEYGASISQSLSDENIRQAKKIMGADKYGLGTDLWMAPKFASRSSGDLNMGAKFQFDRFDGAIEGIKPVDIGMEMFAGSSEVSGDKIIISDFLAFEFTRSGYIGYNNSGQYGIHYPKVIEDVVGIRFEVDIKSLYVEVGGIFKTSYADYKHIMTSSPYNEKTIEDQQEFWDNKNFIYCKFFCAAGYSSRNIDNNTSNELSSVEISSKNGQPVYTSGYPTDYYIYNVNKMQNINADGAWAWIKEGVSLDNDGHPTQLKKNQIIIHGQLFIKIFESDYLGDKITGEVITGFPDFLKHINSPIKLKIANTKNTNIINESGLEIVGINLLGDESVQISQNLYDEALPNASYTSMYFNRGSNAMELKGKIDRLHDEGFYAESAKFTMRTLVLFESGVSIVRTVFVYVALAFSMLTFFIVFNYISASVRFRRKEVAVYRVIGAKTFDISKIFLAEGFYIVRRTTIVASILSFIFCQTINSLLSLIMTVMKVSISIVNFTILHIVLIFVLATAFIVLSSLAPILRITLKKPIDAVKMI